MRRARLILLLALALGACGGDAEDPNPNAGVPCTDDAPGEAAAYANPDVAIGRELAPDRTGGELPWFAKTPLFVRRNREVVVRVPPELSDVVKITGWGENEAAPRDVALVQPSSPCPENWTAYPGGLVFQGRRCARLQVEGPGDAAGSVLIGLRRRCA